MTNDGVHSCNYYCDRPACIERQRDELRERLIVTQNSEERGKTTAWTKEELTVKLAEFGLEALHGLVTNDDGDYWNEGDANFEAAQRALRMGIIEYDPRTRLYRETFPADILEGK